MRLLNIMLAKVRGGVEAMAVRYHEALADCGYQVLSLGHPDGMLASGIAAADFRPLVARVNTDPFAALALRRHIVDFKPDLILCHGNRATGICLMSMTGGRSRTVQVLHNEFFKSHLRHVRAALCVSGHIHAAATVAVPAVPIFEVENFDHLAAGDIRQAPQAPPVLGAMGRLHDQKGFDLLLQAAARLRDQGVAFTLRIAGEGPERDHLQSLIAGLDLQDRATLTGWVAQPAQFLEGLDLFVVPSRYEPFGLVVIEALAAGIPVAASAIEGPREILRDGAYGRLFTSEDIESLTEALRDALADGPGGLQRARTAQAYALSRYGFDAGKARLQAAIEAIVSVPASAAAATS